MNADGAGRRNLRFPKPVDLVDPFTGKRRAQNTTQYECFLKDKETLLLRVEAT